MVSDRSTQGVQFSVHPPLLTAAMMGTVLAQKALGIHSPIPRKARLIGIPLILGGLLIGGSALRAQVQEGDSPDPHVPVKMIVKSGPYRFTRNPMYISMIMMFAGFAILMNALWSLLLLPVMGMGLYRGAIRHEEAYLEDRFGEDYIEYKQRVPRWL